MTHKERLAHLEALWHKMRFSRFSEDRVESECIQGLFHDYTVFFKGGHTAKINARTGKTTFYRRMNETGYDDLGSGDSYDEEINSMIQELVELHIVDTEPEVSAEPEVSTEPEVIAKRKVSAEREVGVECGH